MQDCGISSALAMKLHVPQSHNKPFNMHILIYSFNILIKSFFGLKQRNDRKWKFFILKNIFFVREAEEEDVTMLHFFDLTARESWHNQATAADGAEEKLVKQWLVHYQNMEAAFWKVGGASPVDGFN